MNRGHWIAFSVFLVALFLHLFFRLFPDSVYSSLEAGEFIAASRSLIPAGKSSYLPVNELWWDTSWLFNLLVYLSHRALGLLSLHLLAGLLAGALGLALIRVGGGGIASGFLVLATVSIIDTALVFNSSLPSLFIFALEIHLLSSPRKSRFLLPILFLVWSQIDLSYLAGFFYMILYLAGSLIEAKGKGWRGAILMFFASAIAILPSTNTLKLLSEPSSIYLYWLYWLPSPNFHSLENRLIAVFILAGLAGETFGKERHLGRSLGLLAFFFLSLLSADYLPLAAISAVPGIAMGIGELKDRAKILFPLQKPASSALLVIFSALYFLAPSMGFLEPSDRWEKRMALRFLLKAPFFGEVHHPPDMAGLLSWKTDRKVAMDPRKGLYPRDTLRLYKQLEKVGDKGWKAVAEKYGVKIFLTPYPSDLYDRLATLEDWALVYDSQGYAIFVENKGINLDIIQRMRQLKPRPGVTKQSPSELARSFKQNADRFERKGNFHRAAWDLGKYIILTPQDHASRLRLGKIYIRMGEVEIARRELLRFLMESTSPKLRGEAQRALEGIDGKP